MNAKKLVTAMLASFLAFMLIAVPVLAGARPIDTVQHRYESGDTFVPLRLTAHAYGAAVEWDGPNQTVYITLADGGTRTVVFADIGGFNENGTIWVPYAYAVTLFRSADEPYVALERPDIQGNITRIEYGNHVAYIFGVAHVGRPEWFPLSPIVEDAISRADVFAFESDFSQEPTFEFMEYVASLTHLPDGITLEDVLPPDVFENFILNLATYPTVVYEDVAMLTPASAFARIMQVEIFPYLGVYPAYSVDGYVMQYALLNNRDVVGLNDSLDELKKFLDIDIDIQISVLENFPDWQTMHETFINPDFNFSLAYETADVDLINKTMVLEFDLETAHGRYLFERAINDRGNIFANEIARLLQETDEPTTFFIAIGIGHILGDGQVLVLLEEMGFDIVPIWS